MFRKRICLTNRPRPATSRDTDHYTAPDSGCSPASHVIDKQSSCLGCPFPECVYIMSRSDRERLLASYR